LLVETGILQQVELLAKYGEMVCRHGEGLERLWTIVLNGEREVRVGKLANDVIELWDFVIDEPKRLQSIANS
jgi:hypothetical protein